MSKLGGLGLRREQRGGYPLLVTTLRGSGDAYFVAYNSRRVTSIVSPRGQTSVSSLKHRQKRTFLNFWDRLHFLETDSHCHSCTIRNPKELFLASLAIWADFGFSFLPFPFFLPFLPLLFPSFLSFFSSPFFPSTSPFQWWGLVVCFPAGYAAVQQVTFLRWKSILYCKLQKHSWSRSIARGACMSFIENFEIMQLSGMELWLY